VDWELLVALGVFTVLFLLVTVWASRRVPVEQRRRHWLTSLAVFVVAVAVVLVWNRV
jgi:uncharacterized membrane protein YfcA